MYCPKCGIKNPESGKFCRSCGTDLGNISAAMSGKHSVLTYTVDPRKRGVSWQNAYTKSFTGLAFLLISLIIGFTGNFGAQKWWFWLLIPAFALLSSGISQIFQLKKLEKLEAGFSTENTQSNVLSSQNKNALPPIQTDFGMPQKRSIYDTDDLVLQPSVTENTTRHLEIKNRNG